MKKTFWLSGLAVFVIILVIILPQIILNSFSPIAQAQTSSDWLMLGHDLKRSGYTPNQVNPPPWPYEPVWVRDFWTGDADQADPVNDRAQPLIKGNQVFVAGLKNRIYALDTETGNINWTVQLDQPGMVFATPTISGDTMFVGSTNGIIYAININTGQIINQRKIIEIGGFRSSPTVTSTLVFLGGEDGYFYALDPSSLSVIWRYYSGGPILSTTAVDEAYQRIYFSNEDMYGFALDFQGNLTWKTSKFYGISTANYYPVIVGQGATAKIIFRTSAGGGHRTIMGGDGTLARAAGLDVPEFYRTPWWDPPPGFDINANPDGDDLEIEQQAILTHLGQYPEYKSLYNINASDGTEGATMPILWMQGSNGVAEPPIVGPDGRVIVKARSYYTDLDGQHWFIYGGPVTLDLNIGRYSLIDSSTGQTQDWSGMYFFTPDEGGQLILGGNRLYRLSHGDTVGGPLLNGNIVGPPAPISGGRDYPHYVCGNGKPCRGSYLPFGVGDNRDYLYRGGWFYVCPSCGGDSNGLGMAIGDDKLFYVSNGMLGMYKSGGSGLNYLYNGDWIEPDYGSVTVPSTSELVSYVTDPPPISEQSPSLLSSELETKIEDFVRDVLTNGWSNNTHYQPLLYPNNSPYQSGGIFFVDPTEEAYILGISYPFVSDALKIDIKNYVSNYLLANYPNPLSQIFPTNSLTGKRREAYYIDNDLGRVMQSAGRTLQYSSNTKVYNLWTYTHYTGDWNFVSNYYANIKNACDTISTSSSVNGDFANLVGCYRIANHLNYGSDASNYLDKAVNVLRNRLQWESDHQPTNWFSEEGSGLDTTAFSWHNRPQGIEIDRFKDLTYELGRALHDFASQPTTIQDKFLTTVLPDRIMTKGTGAGESFSNFPTQARDTFLFKAYASGSTAEDLQKFISSPWSKADLYYMEKLVLTIRASASSFCTPRGDVNCDQAVNQQDILTILTSYLRTPAEISNYFDPIGDTIINLLDFGWVVRDWGK